MRGGLLPAITSFWLSVGATASAQPPLVVKPGSLSPLLAEATDIGRAPATEQHEVVIGLELRNRQDLEAFLIDIQDPSSPNYGRFLTQEEFNALYAPTVADEEALISYLLAKGFRNVARYPNRLLVGAVGTVAAMERAFSVEIDTVMRAGQRHYAAVNEPSFPGELARAVVGVIGLDDLNQMHPHVQVSGEPHAALGSNCCHLSPNDVTTFYDNGTAHDGTGQTIVIAGAFAWQDSDNTSFNSRWGLPPLPAGSSQICTGSPGASG